MDIIARDVSVRYWTFLNIFRYMPIGLGGTYMFGSNIDKDVFGNIGSIEPNFTTFILRISFLVIMTAHIPFIFYAGKECFFVLINEI